ncbi:MAG: GTP-binding protein [Gemmatales bacterium]|nr:hypothetical protein [Gemmatales bacterium]MDW7993620.1 GTP-binding protein [Gemmatales bacterium]
MAPATETFLRDEKDLSSIWDAYERGDRRALARLLTWAENPQYRPMLYQRLRSRTQQPGSFVLAITGSPGAGKSTLIGKLLPGIRQRGHTVAVLACDPRSPVSGGALLGDRIRMPVMVEDQGVYIRSLAAPPGRQGIAENLDIRLALLERFGFDWIIVETIGVGQADVAIGDLVDCVTLLIPPESGDEIQWEKAGLLEVADLVVVSKGDLPGAGRTAAQLQQTLNLPGFPAKPILVVSAAKGTGLSDLVQQLETSPRRRQQEESQARRLLLLAQEILAQRFRERRELVAQLMEMARQQGWDDWQAASQLARGLMANHAADSP